MGGGGGGRQARAARDCTTRCELLNKINFILEVIAWMDGV